MYLCNKDKGLFCVASPHFELNKEVDIVEVDLDKNFCENIMSEAIEYWKTAVFPKLI